MAKGFNLTAQINLRGPGNLKPVVAQIRRELGTIAADVKVNVSPGAIKSVDAVTSKLKAMNSVIVQARQNTESLSATFRTLSSSLGSVQSDTSKAAAGITKTASSAATAAKSVKQAGTAMEEFGKQSFLAIKRFAAFSFVTAGIFSLTNAISSGFRAFVNFDKELVKLQQVTGKGAIGIASLEKEITRLATTLGVSSESLIGVASTLAQAGLSAEETRIALEALAKTELAPSFDNLTDTTEGAIAAMRQFGLEAGELESALGSINAVAAAFAVESRDIISAIQRTGGVFATASKGVTEGKDALNEFIAVFTSVRQTTRESAETIATGLRTIFTRIQRASTINQLKEFGVVLTDLEGKFVGPFEAIKRLSEGLSQLDPRDLRFSQIVEELGGFRQIGKVIPLIQQFATAQQALKIAQKGQGSLTEAQIVAQQSLANQLAKVREQFLALIRDVGKSTVFQGLFKVVTGLASAMISLAGAFKPILPILAIMAAVKGVSAITQFATGFFGGMSKGGGARAVGENAGASASGAKEKERTEATNRASQAISENTSAVRTLTTAINSLIPRIDANTSAVATRGPSTLKGGGKVLGFNKGGLVPGYGGGDKVPALLEGGEVVINKNAVRKYGAGNLVRMNKYSWGGTVADLAKIYPSIRKTTNYNQYKDKAVKDESQFVPVIPTVDERIKFQESPGKNYEKFENLISKKYNTGPPEQGYKYLDYANTRSEAKFMQFGSVYRDDDNKGNNPETAAAKNFLFENSLQTQTGNVKNTKVNTLFTTDIADKPVKVYYPQDTSDFFKSLSTSQLAKERFPFGAYADGGKIQKFANAGKVKNFVDGGWVKRMKQQPKSTLVKALGFLESQIDKLQEKGLSPTFQTSKNSNSIKSMINTESVSFRELQDRLAKIHAFLYTPSKSEAKRYGLKAAGGYEPEELLDAVTYYQGGSGPLIRAMANKDFLFIDRNEEYNTDEVVARLQAASQYKTRRTLYSGLGKSQFYEILKDSGITGSEHPQHFFARNGGIDKKIAKKMTGKTIDFPTFLSTSYNKSEAQSFIGDPGAMMQISTAKSKISGIDVNKTKKTAATYNEKSRRLPGMEKIDPGKLIEREDEKEFILPPNTHFQIKRTKALSRKTPEDPVLDLSVQMLKNGGLLQNFRYGSKDGVQRFPNGGIAQRRVGIIDSDALKDDRDKQNAARVAEGMKLLGATSPADYGIKLSTMAGAKRESGSLGRFRFIAGAAGNRKTSLAMGRGANDDATLRKTSRKFILHPDDLNDVDEVLSVTTNLQEAKLMAMEKSDRTYVKDSSTKAQQELVKLFTSDRDTRKNVGSFDTLFSREAGTTKGLDPDYGLSTATLIDRLGLAHHKGHGNTPGKKGKGKVVVLGERTDEEGNPLYRQRILTEKELPELISAKGQFPGAAAPLTRGHAESAIGTLLEKVREKYPDATHKDLLFALAPDLSLDGGSQGREHGARYGILPASFRRDLIKLALPDMMISSANSPSQTGINSRIAEIEESPTGRRRFAVMEQGAVAVVSKTEKENAAGIEERNRLAGLDTYNIPRSANEDGLISGTRVRKAIVDNDFETLDRAVLPQISSALQANQPQIRNRSLMLPLLQQALDIFVQANASKVKEQVDEILKNASGGPFTRMTPKFKASHPNLVKKIESLRKNRNILAKDAFLNPSHELLRIISDRYPDIYGLDVARKVPTDISVDEASIKQHIVDSSKLSAFYKPGLSFDSGSIQLASSLQKAKQDVDSQIKSEQIGVVSEGTSSTTLSPMMAAIKSSVPAEEGAAPAEKILPPPAEVLKTLGIPNIKGTSKTKSLAQIYISGRRSGAILDDEQQAIVDSINAAYWKKMGYKERGAERSAANRDKKGLSFAAAGLLGKPFDKKTVTISSDKLKNKREKVNVVGGIVDKEAAEIALGNFSTINTIVGDTAKDMMRIDAAKYGASSSTATATASAPNVNTSSSIQGGLIEEVIKMMGGPGALKGQGMDFPMGLQGAARFFRDKSGNTLPPDLPTDAKRTISGPSTIKDNIITYLRSKGYNSGGLVQRFMLGGTGKAPRKVDFERGVGPSPFVSAKTKKLGQEVFDLEKDSGFSSREFNALVYEAKTNDFSLEEFKEFLKQRLAEKKAKANLRMSPIGLLRGITPDQPSASQKQIDLARSLMGDVDAKNNPTYDNALKRASGGIAQKFSRGAKVEFGTGETEWAPKGKLSARLLAKKFEETESKERKERDRAFKVSANLPLANERFLVETDQVNQTLQSMGASDAGSKLNEIYKNNISRNTLLRDMLLFARDGLGLKGDDMYLALPRQVDFGGSMSAFAGAQFNPGLIGTRPYETYDLSEFGYETKHEQELYGLNKLIENKEKEIAAIEKKFAKTRDPSFGPDSESKIKVSEELRQLRIKRDFGVKKLRGTARKSALAKQTAIYAGTGRGTISFPNSIGFGSAGNKNNTLFHEMTHQLFESLRQRSQDSFVKYKERINQLFLGNNDDVANAFDLLTEKDGYSSADVAYGRRYKTSALWDMIRSANARNADKPGLIPGEINSNLRKIRGDAERAKRAKEFKPLNPIINKALLETQNTGVLYKQSYIDALEDKGKEEFLTTLIDKKLELDSNLQKVLDDTLTELLGSAGIERQKYARGGSVSRFAAGGIVPSLANGGFVKDALKKSQKTITWGRGGPNEVTTTHSDDRAIRLSTQKKAVDAIEQQLSGLGISSLKFIGSGKDSLAYESNQNNVVKFSPGGLKRYSTNIPEQLKPTFAKLIEGYGVEVMPKVDTNVSDTDLETLKKIIRSKGYEWGDAALDNMGKLGDRLVVIDGDLSPLRIPPPPLPPPLPAAKKSAGGSIQRFPYGGMVDDGGMVDALVSNGEAYVPPRTAQRIGYGTLNRMNQADRNGMGRFSRGSIDGVGVFRGPGSGTSDSIRTRLPVGSYVIRAKATKALGLNKGGSVGVRRFAAGGRTPWPEDMMGYTTSSKQAKAAEQLEFFAYKAKEAGQSVNQFGKILASKVISKSKNLEENLKNRQTGLRYNIIGRSEELRGNKNKDLELSAIRDFAAQLKEIDPSKSADDIERTAKSIVEGLQKGLSLEEITKNSQDVSEVFARVYKQGEAVELALKLVAQEAGLSAEALKRGLGNDNLRQQEFIQSDMGQNFGKLAELFPDLIQKLSKTTVGGGLARVASALSGKGLPEKLEKTFGKVGGMIGSKINVLGGPMVVLGSGLSLLGDNLPKMLSMVDEKYKTSETAAGVAGGIRGVGQGLASGAMLGAMVAGPVGAMIGGIGGAIVNGISSAVESFNQQKLINNIKGLEQSTQSLNAAFKKLELAANEANVSSAQKSLSDVPYNLEKVGEQAQFSIRGPERDRMEMMRYLAPNIYRAIFGGPTEEQEKESRRTVLENVPTILERASTLGDINRDRVPLEQIRQVYERGTRDGISDTERTDIFAEANQTYQMLVRGDRARGIPGVASEQIYKAAGIQARKAQGLPFEQLLDTEAGVAELIKEGKEFLAIQEQITAKQKLYVAGIRDVKVEIDNSIDIYRRAQAGLQRFGQAIESLKNTAIDSVNALRGQASVTNVNRRSEQVLGNLSAYSMDEVEVVASQTARIAGGGPQAQNLEQQIKAGKIIEDELPRILKSTTGQNVDDVIASLENIFEKAKIKAPVGLFSAIQDQIEQKIGGREGASFNDLAEELDVVSIVTKGTSEAIKTAQDIQKQYNDAFQTVIDLTNDYGKALDEITDWQLKASDIRTRADIQLAETLGKTVSFAQQNKPEEQRILGLTTGVVQGGSTDPNVIGRGMINAIENLGKRSDNFGPATGMYAELERLQKDEPNNIVAQAEQLRKIAAQNNAINNSRKALESLANNSDKAANALKLISERQKAAAGGVNILEKLLTSSGEEIYQIQRNLSAYTSMITGRATIEDIDNPQFRQEAFGGLRDLQGLMPDDIFNSMQAQIAERMIDAIPGVSDTLDKTTIAISRGLGDVVERITAREAIRLRAEGIDPKQDALLKAYYDAIKQQKDSSDQLAEAAQKVADTFATAQEKALEQINVQLKTVLDEAAKKAEVVLPKQGPPLPPDPNKIYVVPAAEIQATRDALGAFTIGLETTGKSLERLRERIEGKKPVAPKPPPNRFPSDLPAVSLSRGGVVYAAQGRLVNFQPKGTDTIPAMLSEGEFVVNARSTSKNLGLLQDINSNPNSSAVYSRGGVAYLAKGGMAGGLDRTVQNRFPMIGTEVWDKRAADKQEVSLDGLNASDLFRYLDFRSRDNDNIVKRYEFDEYNSAVQNHYDKYLSSAADGKYNKITETYKEIERLKNNWSWFDPSSWSGTDSDKKELKELTRYINNEKKNNYEFYQTYEAAHAIRYNDRIFGRNPLEENYFGGDRNFPFTPNFYKLDDADRKLKYGVEKPSFEAFGYGLLEKIIPGILGVIGGGVGFVGGTLGGLITGPGAVVTGTVGAAALGYAGSQLGATANQYIWDNYIPESLKQRVQTKIKESPRSYSDGQWTGFAAETLAGGSVADDLIQKGTKAAISKGVGLSAKAVQKGLVSSKLISEGAGPASVGIDDMAGALGRLFDEAPKKAATQSKRVLGGRSLSQNAGRKVIDSTILKRFLALAPTKAQDFLSSFNKNVSADKVYRNISDFIQFIGLKGDDAYLATPSVVQIGDIQRKIGRRIKGEFLEDLIPSGTFGTSGVKGARGTGRGKITLQEGVQVNTLYHELTHQLLAGIRKNHPEAWMKYQEVVKGLFSGKGRKSKDFIKAFDSLRSSYRADTVVYGSSYKMSFLDYLLKKDSILQSIKKGEIEGLNPDIVKKIYESANSAYGSVGAWGAIDGQVNDLMGKLGVRPESIARLELNSLEEYLTIMIQNANKLDSRMRRNLSHTLDTVFNTVGISRDKKLFGDLDSLLTKPTLFQRIKSSRAIISVQEAIDMAMKSLSAVISKPLITKKRVGAVGTAGIGAAAGILAALPSASNSKPTQQTPTGIGDIYKKFTELSQLGINGQPIRETQQKPADIYKQWKRLERQDTALWRFVREQGQPSQQPPTQQTPTGIGDIYKKFTELSQLGIDGKPVKGDQQELIVGDFYKNEKNRQLAINKIRNQMIVLSNRRGLIRQNAGLIGKPLSEALQNPDYKAATNLYNELKKQRMAIDPEYRDNVRLRELKDKGAEREDYDFVAGIHKKPVKVGIKGRTAAEEKEYSDIKNARKSPYQIRLDERKASYANEMASRRQAYAAHRNGPTYRQDGGLIYASKGTIVNYEPRGTDTVPAMLTPGEFVVNAKSTAQHLSLLKSINSGYYADGGSVAYRADGSTNPERSKTDKSSGGSSKYWWSKPNGARDLYWDIVGSRPGAIDPNITIYNRDNPGKPKKADGSYWSSTDFERWANFVNTKNFEEYQAAEQQKMLREQIRQKEIAETSARILASEQNRLKPNDRSWLWTEGRSWLDYFGIPQTGNEAAALGLGLASKILPGILSVVGAGIGFAAFAPLGPGAFATGAVGGYAGAKLGEKANEWIASFYKYFAGAGAIADLQKIIDDNPEQYEFGRWIGFASELGLGVAAGKYIEGGTRNLIGGVLARRGSKLAAPYLKGNIDINKVRRETEAIIKQRMQQSSGGTETLVHSGNIGGRVRSNTDINTTLNSAVRSGPGGDPLRPDAWGIHAFNMGRKSLDDQMRYLQEAFEGAIQKYISNKGKMWAGDALVSTRPSAITDQVALLFGDLPSSLLSDSTIDLTSKVLQGNGPKFISKLRDVIARNSKLQGAGAALAHEADTQWATVLKNLKNFLSERATQAFGKNDEKAAEILFQELLTGAGINATKAPAALVRGASYLEKFKLPNFPGESIGILKNSLISDIRVTSLRDLNNRFDGIYGELIESLRHSGFNIPGTIEQTYPMAASMLPANEPKKYNRGGMIYASQGQYVNFQPKGTDTIPAMLSEGEFVVNAISTSKNLPLLHAINNDKMPKGYSLGGVAYASTAKAAKIRERELRNKGASRTDWQKDEKTGKAVKGDTIGRTAEEEKEYQQILASKPISAYDKARKAKRDAYQSAQASKREAYLSRFRPEVRERMMTKQEKAQRDALVEQQTRAQQTAATEAETQTAASPPTQASTAVTQSTPTTSTMTPAPITTQPPAVSMTDAASAANMESCECKILQKILNTLDTPSQLPSQLPSQPPVPKNTNTPNVSSGAPAIESSQLLTISPDTLKSLQEFNTTLAGTFAQYIDDLRNLEFKPIEHKVEVNVSPIQVQITGAAAMEGLSKEMKSVAEALIAPRIAALRDEISRNSNGQLIKPSPAIGKATKSTGSIDYS